MKTQRQTAERRFCFEADRRIIEYELLLTGSAASGLPSVQSADETFLNIDRGRLLARRSVYLEAAATSDPVGR